MFSSTCRSAGLQVIECTAQERSFSFQNINIVKSKSKFTSLIRIIESFDWTINRIQYCVHIFLSVEKKRFFNFRLICVWWWRCGGCCQSFPSPGSASAARELSIGLPHGTPKTEGSVHRWLHGSTLSFDDRSRSQTLIRQPRSQWRRNGQMAWRTTGGKFTYTRWILKNSLLHTHTHTK